VPPPPVTLSYSAWQYEVNRILEPALAENARLSNVIKGSDDPLAAAGQVALVIGAPQLLRALVPPPCAAATHAALLIAWQHYSDAAAALLVWFQTHDVSSLDRAATLFKSGDAVYPLPVPTC